MFCHSVGTAWGKRGLGTNAVETLRWGGVWSRPSGVPLGQVLWKESWVSPPWPPHPALYRTSSPLCACLGSSCPVVPWASCLRGMKKREGGMTVSAPCYSWSWATVGSSYGLCDHKQAVWVELCPQRDMLEPYRSAQTLTYGLCHAP